MAEPESDRREVVIKDEAYFGEVRKALGRGAPTVLLGTSNRKLDRIMARLVRAASSRGQETKAPFGTASDVATRTMEEHDDDSDRVPGQLSDTPSPLEGRDSQSKPFKVAERSDPAVGGYGSEDARTAAGITRRLLDDWVRTGVVEPSVGTGSTRLFGFRDIVELILIKRLLDVGIELEQILTAVTFLRAQTTRNLAEITLISDGTIIYQCTDPDEIVDLLRSGQGVFGIAVGRVLQEVEATLAQLPAGKGHASTPSTSQVDELKNRREPIEVHGYGNNEYQIVEGGPQGWQALVRNGPTWTEMGYYGATTDEVLRMLRRDGKIA